MENKIELAREITSFVCELKSPGAINSNSIKNYQMMILGYMGRLMANRGQYTKEEYEQLDTLLNDEHRILFPNDENKNKSR